MAAAGCCGVFGLFEDPRFLRASRVAELQRVVTELEEYDETNDEQYRPTPAGLE